MIVKIKNTAFQIVIPDGYKEIGKKEIPDSHKLPDGSSVYQKLTPNANCSILAYKVDEDRCMPFDNKDAIIDGIHANLKDNQGLIAVENGTTARGFRYVYTIVKIVDTEDIPGGVTYVLRINLANEDEYVQLHCDFIEAGNTGMRDSFGYCLAMQAKLVSLSSEDGTVSGWDEDPYDPDFDRGIRMNLSEREGLDGTFPDHPLSQAREFVHAVIHDELMRPADDSDADSKNPKEENSAAESPEQPADNSKLFREILSKDVTRKFVPEKVII